MVILFRAYSTKNTEQSFALYREGEEIRFVGELRLVDFDRVEFFEEANAENDNQATCTVINTVKGSSLVYDKENRLLSIDCGVRIFIGNRFGTGDNPPPEASASVLPWTPRLAVRKVNGELALVFTSVDSEWALGKTASGEPILPGQLWRVGLGADADEYKVNIWSRALCLVPFGGGDLDGFPQLATAYYLFVPSTDRDIQNQLDSEETFRFRSYVLQFERLFQFDQTGPVQEKGILEIHGLSFKVSSDSKFWLIQAGSAAPEFDWHVAICNLDNDIVLDRWNREVAELYKELDFVEGTDASLAPQINRLPGSYFGIPLRFKDNCAWNVHLGSKQLPNCLVPKNGPVQPLPMTDRPQASQLQSELNDEPNHLFTFARFHTSLKDTPLDFKLNILRSDHIDEGFVRFGFDTAPTQTSRRISFQFLDYSDFQVSIHTQFYKYQGKARRTLKIGDLDFHVPPHPGEQPDKELDRNCASFSLRFANSSRAFSSTTILSALAVSVSPFSSEKDQDIETLSFLTPDASLIDTQSFLQCKETIGNGLPHRIAFLLLEGVEKDSAAPSIVQKQRSIVVLSAKPFIAAQITGIPLRRSGVSNESMVLGHLEYTGGMDTGWKLRASKDLELTLGPQGLGEEIDRFPKSDPVPDLTPRTVSHFRFTPAATLRLQASNADRNYAPPIWNINSLLLKQSPRITEFEFESFYSLYCKATLKHHLLDELSTSIGWLPSTGEEWRPRAAEPYDKSDKKWTALRSAASARPIYLTPRDSEAVPGQAEELSVDYSARGTSQLRYPYPGPLPDTLKGHIKDGLSGGLAWALRGILDDKGYSAFWEVGEGTGTIKNPAFSSFGLTGDTESEFDLGKDTIRVTVNSSTGRVSKLVAVKEGRIGILGNRAVLVDTFERTVMTGISQDEDRRPALKLIKSEIVVVEQSKSYPDDSNDRFCNGFIRGNYFDSTSFAYTQINATDYRLTLKDQTVHLQFAKDVAGNTIQAKLRDTNELYFRTKKWSDTNPEDNFDCPGNGTTAAPLPGGVDYFAPSHPDHFISDAFATVPAPYNGRFCLALEVTTEPVNLLFGKDDKRPHFAFIESVSIARLQVTNKASGSAREVFKANSLSLLYSVWKPVNTDNLRYNRRTILGFFTSRAESLSNEPILTNPAAVIVNRPAGSPQNYTSCRIPVQGVSGQIVPALGRPGVKARHLSKFSGDVSRIFPDIGGIQLDNLMKGVNSDEINNKLLNFDEAFESSEQSATFTGRFRVPLGDTNIFSKVKVGVDVKKTHLVGELTYDLLSGTPELTKVASGISGDWHCKFGGDSLVIFGDATIWARDKNVSFDIKKDKIKIVRGFNWLNKLLGTSGNSPTGAQLKFDLDVLSGVEIGLNVALPGMDWGLFSLTSAHLFAGIGLYWSDKFCIGASFSLANPQKPFVVLWCGFGGGGWFYTWTRYYPSTNEIDFGVGIGITCGNRASFNWLGIKGSVSYTLGISGEYKGGTYQGFSITVFLILAGELNFFDIVSASALVYLAGTVTDDKVVFIGELRIEIDVCWWFTLKVHKQVKSEIPYKKDTAAFASSSIPSRTSSDFEKYAAAYIEILE